VKQSSCCSTEARDDIPHFQATTKSLSVPHLMCWRLWQAEETFTTARRCCGVFVILAPDTNCILPYLFRGRAVLTRSARTARIEYKCRMELGLGLWSNSGTDLGLGFNSAALLLSLAYRIHVDRSTLHSPSILLIYPHYVMRVGPITIAYFRP